MHFSNGFMGGTASHSVAAIDDLIETGKFWLPVDRTFSQIDIAKEHRISETGWVRGVRGRLALVIS